MSIVTKSITDYLESIAKDHNLFFERNMKPNETCELRYNNKLWFYHKERSISFRILELCDDPYFDKLRNNCRLIFNISTTSDPEWFKEEDEKCRKIVDESLSISDPKFYSKLHAILDPFLKTASLLNADVLIRDYVSDNQSILSDIEPGDGYRTSSMMPGNKVSVVINESDYTIDLVRRTKKITLAFNTQFNTKDPDLITKVDQYIHSIGGI